MHEINTANARFDRILMRVVFAPLILVLVVCFIGLGFESTYRDMKGPYRYNVGDTVTHSISGERLKIRSRYYSSFQREPGYMVTNGRDSWTVPQSELNP